MKTVLITAAAAFATLSPAAALAAASPFNGTWKTDMSSINFSKRPDVLVIKDGVYDCRSCTPAYKVKADGAFHRISGHPAVEETMIKVVDARSLDQVNRKGGRVVGKSRTTASADGKTATIAWTDMTNAGAPPASGTLIQTRSAAGPAGSHVLSGSWVAAKAEGLTDNATVQSLKLEGGVLSMTTPTGQAYSAKIDGTPAPFTGDPAVTTVSVKQSGPREIVETDMEGGKPVYVLRMTVSPDGKTLTLHNENKKTGATSSATANRV